MTTEPLSYEISIACSVDHAFETWTAKLDSWWPKDHTISGDPEAILSLEPHVDGRILERASDGRTFLWGRVTRWEPPHQLEYEWLIGQDPDQATQVEITFSPDGAATVLRVVHGGWERLEQERDARRTANERGWNALLSAFGEAIGALQS